MVEVTVRYEGDLRCTATHGPSHTTLQTDAPVDNMGKGESFSPTDLVATGLGTCILTILGIISQRHSIPIAGAAVSVTKVMTAQPPRRIARLGVTITIPQKLTDEQKQRLINAASTCPVKQSLHPDIEVPMHWNWG
jgi:putative redox protein